MQHALTRQPYPCTSLARPLSHQALVETKNGVACGVHLFVALFVEGCLFCAIMNWTIDLNDQFRIMAYKIGNISGDPLLGV